MNKLLSALIISIFIASCQNTEEKQEIEQPKVNTAFLAQADSAKNWLVPTVEKFFNENHSEILEICTPEYEEYKMDAIQVDYDGGMTIEQFQKKWKGKYNTNNDEIGKSFLLAVQDYGKIKFKSCELASDSTLVFDTAIEDSEFKAVHKRKITVVKRDGKFLINDVAEIK